MKNKMKWAFRGLLFLTLALGGTAVWKRDDITRLMAVNS